MVVLQGLLALIAAVAAVATNSDSTQPLSDNFVISGQHFNGLRTGQQVLCGIAVRLVDLLRSGKPGNAFASCPNRRQRQTAVRPWLPPSSHPTSVAVHIQVRPK